MVMTPRERVLMAINNEEPDRVPIMLGTSNTTGIKMPAYRRLKEYLNIEAPDRYIYNSVSYTHLTLPTILRV